MNHPEFQQVGQFHRFLFVTGAAGLEEYFTGFFSQLFDLLAKLQPSFMLQPLEIRVVKDRRFHRKTAAGIVWHILEHPAHCRDQTVVLLELVS